MIHRKRKIGFRMIVKLRLDWSPILLSGMCILVQGAQREYFFDDDSDYFLFKNFTLID